jgi:hypothetical protein
MEKRRVRLYKAQEGGQPSADMLGYPGAQQAQATQMNEQQLVQAITQDISNDLPKEAIVAKLVNVMGVDMMQANQYVEAVYTMLENQMEEPDEDEETDPAQVQQDVVEEQIAKPMTKMVMHNDLAQEDDEDLTDLEDEDMVKYGGMPRAAEGLETGWGNRYEVQFPGLEAYLPSNMEEQFSNPAADIAWQAPEEIVSEEEVEDYTQPVADPSDFRMGGYKTKKGYVNSVLKLVKKQLGGDQEIESNDADPRGEDLRKSHLNAFIGSIKKEGNMSLAKQQAEEQYDQMMAMHQQQMGQPDLSAFIPQNEMGMDQAQYGGMPREQRRAVKQLQRTLKRLPVGNVGPVSKFDVHRSGLFGGPKEYTIEFDKPLVQLASNPMLAANYGYGFGTKVTRTPARVKTEYVKNVVNSEALKEVAKETGSEAAAKATVNTDTPSAAANPVAPATTPAAATTPVATVPVTTSSVAPVTTAPVTTVTPPVVLPPAPKQQITPAPGIDLAPGLTNVQQNIASYTKPTPEKPKPTMAELTKRAAANPSSVQNVSLPGDDNLYWKKGNEWFIDDYSNDSNYKFPKVTNKEVINKLNAGKGKGADYYTLKDKPGYVYRKRADGAYVKLKENANGTISNKATAVIKPGDKNYDYLKKKADNIKWKVGGSVDNPFVNAYGDLQKFMGGGDDISIPELTQGDIDDVYSKDTTDAYMPEAQRGGAARALTQQYFPANMPQRQYTSQMVKGPYDRVTGNALASIPGYNPNAVIKDIKVTKEGVFGRPRRYTVTYNNNPSGDPDDRQLAARPITVAQTTPQAGTTKETKGEEKLAKQTALENAGYGQKTDVTGLKAKSKRAIRQGERQRDRDLEKLYEEDPTSVEFDPINIDAPFDRTASNNSAYNVSDLSTPTTEEDFATWGTPREAIETQTAYQFPEGDYNDDAGWGMPQDMVVGPSGIPTTVNQPSVGQPTADQTQVSTPAPIAKPATGKQTEEFCFGNSCFEVPDQQKTEYDLFYETPDLFSDYGRKNNSPWFNSETGEVDLSQVDAETAKKIIKEGIPKNVVLKGKSFDDANIDAYSDAWLKYSQDNQEAYGDKSWNSLHSDGSALPSQGLAEKYADFLNATGQTAEGKPYSIWDTTGPLGFNEQQAAQLVQQPNVPRQMTSDFGPMSMEGPMSTEQDQVPTLEEQYMEGFQPTITRDMIDQASGLRIPQEPVNMGAWSGMSYPGMPIQPGLNPFDLPVGGGQDYYPPFAQPIASRNDQPINRPAPSGPTLEQVRNQQRRNPNADKDYTFKPNMAGMQKDPDYMRIMQNAGKDGTITNQEVENATRIFKQKQAEQEKAKVASQAQRTINQIMNSSASTAEKNKAREKVVLQMQQRWDVIDRATNSRKYGGALNKFIPQALLGTETSVSMENNPTAPNVDIDKDFRLPTVSSKEAGQQWFEQSRKNLQAEANYQPDEYTVDYKSKSRVNDTQGALNSFNAAARGATGIIDRLANRKQEAQMYDNLNADNLYASDPSRDRGDYDTNTGLYRPDEQGQSWNSRSAQYGGSIYEEGGYVEGQEVYMTDDELDEFLANGGEVEYI